MESSLPHIIVDSLGQPRSKPMKSRAAATRLLHQLQRRRSPFLIGDPKTWTVKPVKEI
jgi:hypothetical protein